MDEIGRCREQLAVLREEGQSLSGQVAGLEEEIKKLTGLRDARMSSLGSVESRMGEAVERGQLLVNRIAGLCVRTLPPPVLKLILQFADDRGDCQLVSKEWCQVSNDGEEIWNRLEDGGGEEVMKLENGGEIGTEEKKEEDET